MPDSAPSHATGNNAQEPLIHVIYVSKAISSMDDLQLAQLLAHCRERNAQTGITGMLLYKSGAFMQVVEGPETPVRELLSKIEVDTRHTDVEILRDRQIASRSFPEWTMAFTNVDRLDLSRFEGFSGFRDIQFDAGYFQTQDIDAHQMLLTFKQELWEIA